jgi:hypothetical protein
MRQVDGEARVDAVCDGCGEDLPASSKATAVSLYSESIPYFEWEGNFIRPSRDVK